MSLQGDARERVAVAEQRRVNFVLLGRERVQHDEVAIRVGGAQVGGHVADFAGALRVFLADVPVERERVAEAGNHLAAVEPPLGAERAAVERGGRRG
jgi:predicted ThiF/HesA family dinucleotide-utilizing enzyme